MKSITFSTQAQIPTLLNEEITKINNRNQVTKKCEIVDFDEYKAPSGNEMYNIALFVEGDVLWGGWRLSVETQLMKYGVIRPYFTMKEEFSIRELKKQLDLFLKPGEIEDAVTSECIVANLNGIIDRLREDRCISDIKYCKLRLVTGSIKTNPFKKDWDLYFGETQKLPVNYWL